MNENDKVQIQYVSEKVVLEITGLDIPTLRNYRYKGIGSDYIWWKMNV